MLPQSQPDNPLRTALAKLRTNFEQRVQALAEALGSGRIDIPQWQRAMQDEVRRYHLAAAAIGAGGLALTTAALVALAQQRAAEEVVYLNRWTDEMVSGAFPVDATLRIRQRAMLYAGAISATFEAARGASQGIPDLGIYPGDGRTRCRTNCRCSLEYVPVEGGVDIYWRLAAVEHCPDCERLAAAWNPLRVRNGQIVA